MIDKAMLCTFHKFAWAINYLSRNLFQCLTTFLRRKCFLVSSWTSPGAVLSHSYLSYHWIPGTPFPTPQERAESNEAAPQPSFHQTSQTPSSQLLLTGYSFQPFHQHFFPFFGLIQGPLNPSYIFLICDSLYHYCISHCSIILLWPAILSYNLSSFLKTPPTDA